jgi:hypothetical protein
VQRFLEKIKKIPRKTLIIIVAAVIALIVASTATYVYFVVTRTTVTTTSVSASQDYDLWVKPYLAQLARIETVLTQPYTPGSKDSYGYDPNIGLVCGGNVEPSAAIGVQNGYNNVCVLIDNNLEGGASLDYFASSSSVLVGQPDFNQENLQIYTDTRNYLLTPFYGVGPCTSPFPVYNYPSNFTLLDRREAEYGFAGPYASELIQPGIHVGGIGKLSCNGSTEDGQIWYLESYDNSSGPMLVAELPSSTPPSTSSDLEELSFVIDELYMQCIAGTVSCSQWQTAYQNAMSQYPFQAPRDALHFIQVTRATGAWAMSNMSYNGVSAESMLQNTISRIFTPESSGGALGPDGGLSQTWGSGSDETPEPNMQAMIAFDPRMPYWFTVGCEDNSSSCTLS